eukprot:3868436-Prymnesium_polylepis.1
MAGAVDPRLSGCTHAYGSSHTDAPRQRCAVCPSESHHHALATPPQLPHRHAAPTVPVRPDALHLPVDVARRALPGLLWRGPGVWS